ncbi:MAG: LptF/LptG family permease [Myxococcota bacterium]|nr:LptF/LptG family permease [Myxococcota bacterium]
MAIPSDILTDAAPPATAGRDPRRMGGTLRRHFLLEVALPTLFLLVVLSLLVLTEDMLGFSVLVMNRGFGAGAVASTALYKLVPALGSMLPFAVLTGCLVGLGRLGADRELLVLEASGLSAPRLLPPLLLFAALAASITLAVSLVAAPWANRGLDAKLEELARARPWSAIQAGAVNGFGDWKIRAQEASTDGAVLGGVQVWVPSTAQTIFARAGRLEAGGDGTVRLSLEGGVALLSARDEPSLLRFDEATTELPTDGQAITRKAEHRLDAYTVEQLGEDGSWKAEAELHRRFAAPVATLVFGALALPLFLGGARFSRSGGWLVGIASSLVYYGLVHLGRGLAEAGTLSPALGTWLPNLIFASVAGFFTLRLAEMSAFAGHLSRPKSRERRRVGRAGASRSWPLPHYVASSFVKALILSFAVLLVAYLIIDVLERVDRFARYGATPEQVLRYYGARIPLLVSRILPMAMLVATTLTVSTFAAHGELVAMRSCGIPAPRALGPILVICAAIVPLHFLLNDLAVPRAHAFMDHVNDVEIKGRAQGRERIEVWYRTPDRFFEADLFDPQAGVARNLTLYELGPDGFPTARSDIARARHVGGGMWRLRDHARVEVVDGRVQRVVAQAFASLGDEDLAPRVDTRHLSLAGLQTEIGELEAGGVDALPFRVDLYVKLATPFACLVLPALALFFALGGPPPPSVAATLVFSACVAAAYTLASGVGVSLGYSGTAPPPAAAFGPVLLFGAAAGLLATRLSVFR